LREQNQGSDLGLRVEIVNHYSNTPELLSDLRRTLQAVTGLVEEVDDEPDLSDTAPTDRPGEYGTG